MLQQLRSLPFLVLCNTLSAAYASGAFVTPAVNCSSESIPKPDLFGAEVVSLHAYVNETFEGLPGNDVCFVTVTITHPGIGDRVKNYITLPINGWNSRFQGIGGGGYAAGSIESMSSQTALGYSTATTDAGRDIDADSGDATLWALLSPGNVDQDLLLNFARRSLHDMTIVGKAISESFYDKPISYSYWNGCSTGGREGLTMAQYYPHDYDGILADAPAIQWSDFTLAQQWPFTAETNEDYVFSPCEQEAVSRVVVEACDGLDGLVDGIVSAPALCTFSAQSLVGKQFSCSMNGSSQTYSKKLVDVVDMIWQGPRTPENGFLWYGLPKGANFSDLAPNTNTSVALPFDISDTWIRGFLARDYGFDTSNISYEQFTGKLIWSII